MIRYDIFLNGNIQLITQMTTKYAFAAIILALILAISGCSQSAVPIEGKDSIPNNAATRVSEKDALQDEKPKRVLTPAQMGFPPEQPAPWAMTVLPEPLSPVKAANTGDFRGKWPEYSAPREIRITAPELPPGIEGPTLDGKEASSSGGT